MKICEGTMWSFRLLEWGPYNRIPSLQGCQEFLGVSTQGESSAIYIFPASL